MSKILIVEDEAFLVTALKDTFEAEGFAVDTATNGDEAMEWIKKRRPDIILLDLLMPRRDGFYVLEELKKNPEWKLIPVIVLSNLGGDAEIKRALEMGADDYFVKAQHPIEEVIDKVKEYFVGAKAIKPVRVKKEKAAEEVPPAQAALSAAQAGEEALAEEKKRAEEAALAEERRKAEEVLAAEKKKAEEALVEGKKKNEEVLAE